MPEVQETRGNPEVPNDQGLIIDLSSPTEFDRFAFDREIRKVGTHSAMPDGTSGDMYHAKFVVLGDKIIVVSADLTHKEGIELMKRNSPEVDLGGEIKAAGYITTKYRFSRLRERVISGGGLGFEPQTMSQEKSDDFIGTVLRENLGEFFTIE